LHTLSGTCWQELLKKLKYLKMNGETHDEHALTSP
jgi:hypothetical protein